MLSECVKPLLDLGLGGYRSGQTGQTVNLLAMPSQVRILHPPLFLMLAVGVCEKLGLFGQIFARGSWCI